MNTNTNTVKIAIEAGKDEVAILSKLAATISSSLSAIADQFDATLETDEVASKVEEKAPAKRSRAKEEIASLAEVKTTATGRTAKTLDGLGFSDDTVTQLNASGITTRSELRKASKVDLRNMKGATKLFFTEIGKFLNYDFLGTGTISEEVKAVTPKVDKEPKKDKRSVGRPSVSLKDVGLSTHTIKVLKNEGIESCTALRKMPTQEIIALDGGNRKVIDDIGVYLGRSFEKAIKKAAKASAPTTVEAKAEVKPPKATKQRKKDLSVPVTSIDFDQRTQNAFEKSNIKYLSEVEQLTSKDLLNMDGIGRKGVAHINKVLSSSQLIAANEGKHSIVTLPLTARTETALFNAGYKYVEQLQELSDDEIMEIQGLGLTGYKQIKKALHG